jgi:hypothetical protein
MLPCLYDEKQHEILQGGEIVRYCQKVAPAKDRPRVFLYRHRIYKTFVIAMWAKDRAMGIFTDFLNLGKSLGNFNREKADEFSRRLYKPLSPKEMSQTIESTSRDYSRMRQDEDAEEAERLAKRAKGETD